MMRRTLVLIGGLCVLLPAATLAAEEAPITGLYPTVLQMTRQENNQSSAELALKMGIPQILAGKTAFPITAQHVEAAITNKFSTLCSNGELKDVTFTECMEVAAQIVEVAQRESWIRALGRDLMMIATSYEPEADGHTGRKHELSVKLPAAMYWWQSGSDRATNPAMSTKIRLMTVDDDEFEEHADDISGILSDFSFDSIVTLLQRYKHGYAVVQGKDNRGDCDEDEDEGGGGGELGELTIRSCELEVALHKTWEDLPHDELQNVQEGELVVFPVFDLTVPGFSNVVLWLRADDVGLLWGLPVQPVLPDITVPGGSYIGGPGAPGLDEGICSHAFGKRGYLCRPQELEDCPIDLEPLEPEQGEEEPVGGTIELHACVPHKFETRKIESGSNSCQVGGWRIPTEPSIMLQEDTPTKDNKLQAELCENCKVDLYCQGDCDGALGMTYNKNEKGVIPICLKQQQEVAPYEYIVLHELVHAQQKCNLPIEGTLDSDTQAGCCTAEYYPNVVMCKAMMEDGLVDVKKFTLEECAMMLSNESCATWEYACTGEPPDIDSYNERKELLWESFKPPPPQGQECQNAIRQMSERALSIKESLKLSCTPGCEAQYENTIGNNLCYISQCVEESLEAHRLIPGRIPYVTQDEAYPWDSCMKDRSELPDLVAIPPLTRTFLPQYRGRDLVEQMDMLLCQVSGLPKLSPPILCTFHPNRRTNQPLRDYADTFSSLLSLNEESAMRAQDLQGSAQNIGTRMGTMMYQNYLHKALREFADLVRAANGLIYAVGDTQIPSVACPRNYTGGCGIFQ
jgi:hypothetical protein